MKTLALLHTSMVFIKVETMLETLLQEIMPDVRRINILDDSLLADVMTAGEIPAAVTQRASAYIQAAEAAGADAVLSLCSSLGPAVDIARGLVKIPVIKIDDAMAEAAVRQASRIGVIATVRTTLNPTVDLIRSKAEALAASPEIYPVLVDGAFQTLMSGDRDKHDQLVMRAAGELASRADILVLAQGSMTRLAPAVYEKTGMPVLTSPRLGIEYTKSILDTL